MERTLAFSVKSLLVGFLFLIAGLGVGYYAGHVQSSLSTSTSMSTLTSISTSTATSVATATSTLTVLSTTTVYTQTDSTSIAGDCPGVCS